MIALVGGALSVLATSLSAQGVPQPAERITRCDGATVSHVEIRRSARTVMDKAQAPGWSRALLQPLLLGTPTRASAIEPFVQLHDGGPCTEQRRAESERLLRLLPYLADATVRVYDEPDGRVRVEVETSDDIRPIIGLELRKSQLNDLELGNGNINGSGQLAAARWHQGGAYRDGLGVRYADFHVLGAPNILNALYYRAPLGSFGQLSLGRPFYTDLQHTAAYAGYVKDGGYLPFTRPVGDPFSVYTTRERADAGVAFRLNTIGRVTYLVGAIANYERRTAASSAVIVTDKALIDTTTPELTGRYREQRNTRAAIALGIRALTFARVRAFDGLERVQDVATGMQFSTTIGKSVGGDDRRPFVTADLYAGRGDDDSFIALRVQGETRQNPGGWGNGVASGRFAWYLHPSKRQTRSLSLEYAGSSSDSVPYQLTMTDAQGGVRGYTGSRLSGGRRAVARVEERVLLPGISKYLGWGVAAFSDAGQMWASKVPFGESGFRASAGLSVLAAVPRQSRSVARVDIAYPLARDPNAKGLDVRVSYRVTPRAFWREPTQISRARLGSPTTDIFSWP